MIDFCSKIKKRWYYTRRDLLCSLLREIPQISFYKPRGAFYVICDILSIGFNADEFAKQLLDKEKLAVIPCTSFGSANCIRLSYACSEEHIKKSIAKLHSFIKKLTR